MDKLKQAIEGQTVTVTWAEVGMNYDTMKGFPSVADLQNWCRTFRLTCTAFTNADNTPAYKISKS